MNTLQEQLRERVITRWIHSTGAPPHSAGMKPDALCWEAADRIDALEADLHSDAEWRADHDALYPHTGKATVAILFVFFLVCLIPSKNTMYAIAASEVGEAALKSKIGEKSMKALELWIDNQIEKKVK